MRFWIDCHGCAKNDVDAEEIAARLETAGHSFADGIEGADLVIVNTCGFIEDAKKESIQAVVALKAAWPDKRILVAGCLSQRYAAELADDLDEADGVVGNADLGAVLAAAEATLAGERPVLVPEIPRTEASHTQLAEGEHVQPIPYSQRVERVRRVRRFDFPGTAHVKATEGCSNGCAFCAIPLIRGALRSRPLEEVLAECQDLLAQGVRELVLIGQDLGSYGRDLAVAGDLLVDLLAALSAVPGDFRVRTLYIHPDNFPERMLPIMAADPRLVPYFDLPFQHASGRILRAMNRRGTGEGYLELLARIRAVLPDAAIRSTFLVGFPGETELDFAALRAFQDDARLDWVGSFAYSREEGTASYAMAGRVTKKVVEARRRDLEEAQERITRAALQRFIGRELEVLVEEIVAPGDAEGAEELSIGRAWNQAPEVDGLTVLRGRHEPGSVVRARVLAVNGVDFDALPL